ncbi:hypothetical protein [Phaeobacter phage MD18]|nr:hypothetical protein [Phaeobacter phage MD18]
MPLRPEDMPAAKAKVIPQSVFDAFDEEIARAWDGKSSVVMQEAVLTNIMTRNACTRDVVFSNKWLDVETVYRAAGWSVKYDKPGYCENYEASFVFSAK